MRQHLECVVGAPHRDDDELGVARAHPVEHLGIRAVAAHHVHAESRQLAADDHVIIHHQHPLALSAQGFHRPHPGRPESEQKNVPGRRLELAFAPASAERMQRQQRPRHPLAPKEGRQGHRDQRRQRKDAEGPSGQMAERHAADAQEQGKLAGLRQQEPALDRRTSAQAPPLRQRRDQRRRQQDHNQRELQRAPPLRGPRHADQGPQRHKEQRLEEIGQRRELTTDQAVEWKRRERKAPGERAHHRRKVKRGGDADEQEEHRHQPQQQAFLIGFRPLDQRWNGLALRDPRHSAEEQRFTETGGNSRHTRPEPRQRHNHRDQRDILHQKHPGDHAPERLKHRVPAPQLLQHDER